MEDIKHCSDCRHYEYKANTAHKSRCKKFGESTPTFLVRRKDGPCEEGKAWEPKAKG